MKLSFIFVSVLVSSLAYSEAKTFLEVTEQDAERKQSVEEAPEDMFQVLLNALADNNVPDDRLVKQMEVALGPMFKTLHTNSLGNLAPQVARYALHRLFEQRHSWSVLGLRPKKSNASTDLDTEGIPRTNLAVLAAILESKIHQEFIGQVTASYVAVGRSVDDAMTRADLEEFVKRFLTLFIAGERDYSLGSDEVSKHMEFMANSTKDWPETLQWMSESLRVAIKSQGHCYESSNECTFDFDDVTGIVEKIVQGYGRFNNKECRRLKDTLLKMEDGKTGRVSLGDFYKEGMSGTWEFNEKADYLRDLGALDESTGRPRVIVANYVNSWVNCLQTSDFYSVCCSNECEDILGHLERKLEVSAAKPEKILTAMQTLPSDISVAIPDSQEGRLHTIADRNHGEVPLHGRLFAQWLHHVFPQSCPYPHQAGATNPLTPDQWLKETGNSAIRATQEEIMMVIGSEGVQNSQDSMNQHMPWTDVEDVVVLHQPVAQDKRHAFADVGVMALEVLATVVMFYIVSRSSGRLRVRFGKGSFKQVSI